MDIYSILVFTLVASTGLINASVLDTAKENGCTQLVELVKQAGLQDALNAAHGITLFAPSDAAISALPQEAKDAFAKNITLLQEVLKFHVAKGEYMSTDIQNDDLLATLTSTKLRTNVYDGGKLITVDGNQVIKADLRASNGVVHIIQSVAYPIPSWSIPLALNFDREFTSLGYMAYQAKLINKLMEQGLTVFAPTNAAVAKIPGQEYNNLLMNFTELTSVLTYHVVKGTYYAASLTDGMKLDTLQGGQLLIEHKTDGITLNGAKVTLADFGTTNGVIHGIDTVLFPKTATQQIAILG